MCRFVIQTRTFEKIVTDNVINLAENRVFATKNDGLTNHDSPLAPHWIYIWLSSFEKVQGYSLFYK